MMKLSASIAGWGSRESDHGAFETPSSLVGRLDRELDAALASQGRLGKGGVQRMHRPVIVDRAALAVTHGLSEAARLCAHVALAGALGIMSARLVQLIAAMG